MPRGYPKARPGMLVTQRGFLDCCSARDQHRFDCPAEPETFRRSGGPFLPTKVGT